jgi:mannose-6-phosphate isomerase-like protein (cupin superfamily)
MDVFLRYDRRAPRAKALRDGGLTFARPNPMLGGQPRRSSVPYKAINFAAKLGAFEERWAPKVIAEMNDYQFKLVKLEGEFVWHSHEDTDETFIVLDGALRIEFRDGAVELEAGEMFVVPRGVDHRPSAENEARVLLIEPRGVLNTGQAGGELTAENDVWI